MQVNGKVTSKRYTIGEIGGRVVDLLKGSGRIELKSSKRGEQSLHAWEPNDHAPGSYEPQGASEFGKGNEPFALIRRVIAFPGGVTIVSFLSEGIAASAKIMLIMAFVRNLANAVTNSGKAVLRFLAGTDDSSAFKKSDQPVAIEYMVLIKNRLFDLGAKLGLMAVTAIDAATRANPKLLVAGIKNGTPTLLVVNPYTLHVIRTYEFGRLVVDCSINRISLEMAVVLEDGRLYVSRDFVADHKSETEGFRQIAIETTASAVKYRDGQLAFYNNRGELVALNPQSNYSESAVIAKLGERGSHFLGYTAGKDGGAVFGGSKGWLVTPSSTPTWAGSSAR